MELLQVFDENKNMLNEYIERDLKKTLTDGKHFMIILLFIENNGKFLIQKTSIKKNSEYATTGGHATFKDNSMDTVIKEAKEELNIDFKEYEIEFVKCIDYKNCFCDIYYTNKIIEDKDIILQEEEVESIEWLSISEIEDLIEKGMFRKGNIEPFKYILEYKNSLLCRIMNDNYINNIINKINDVILVDNCGDHGMNHALRVMKYVEILLIGNNASEKEIELGKIAAYLHDIGAVEGKKNHAIRSSEFVNNYLDKYNISKEDKEIIVHAIKDHSKGDELNSNIGAVLTFADKIDMFKDRMLRFIDGNYFHDNIKHMLNVELSVLEDNIYVNIVTDGMFDYNSLKEYSKMILIPIKMSNYMNKKCIFLIDNKEIDLYSVVNNNNIHFKIK